jgi:dTDP-4-amino-4,6-dideoxygalactose transaminase
LAALYYDALQSEPGLLLPEPDVAGHCWHIYTPLLPLDDVRLSRANFIQCMQRRGIGVGVHYPALHRLKLYDRPGYAPRPCPNAERIGRQTITLPLFPAMTDSDVERVCAAVRRVLATSRSGRAA